MKVQSFKAALGFLLLFLSSILLLTTSGLVSWNLWLFVWQFWPMLFVLFGAAFLMKRWSFNFFLALPVFLVIFGIVGGGLWLTWKDQYFNTQIFKDENVKGITTTKLSNEIPKKVEESDVKVIFGASNIKLEALSDKDSPLLYEGIHNSNFFTLNHKMQTVGEDAKLTLKSSPFIKRPFSSKSINELNLAFSQKLEYSFDIQTGSSSLDLDFERLKVKKLDIDSGASKIEVRLGSGNTDFNINSGASSVKLYLPKDTGIKVETKSALTSHNFSDINLEKTKSGWQSKNLEKMNSVINIELKSGLSKIEIVR